LHLFRLGSGKALALGVTEKDGLPISVPQLLWKARAIRLIHSQQELNPLFALSGTSEKARMRISTGQDRCVGT